MSDTPANIAPDTLPERMHKTHFSIVPLADADGDNAYWHAQTPFERLAALERLRRRMSGDDASTARLSRLLSASALREG